MVVLKANTKSRTNGCSYLFIIIINDRMIEYKQQKFKTQHTEALFRVSDLYILDGRMIKYSNKIE